MAFSAGIPAKPNPASINRRPSFNLLMKNYPVYYAAGELYYKRYRESAIGNLSGEGKATGTEGR
jgi:hypothetical protein